MKTFVCVYIIMINTDYHFVCLKHSDSLCLFVTSFTDYHCVCLKQNYHCFSIFAQTITVFVWNKFHGPPVASLLTSYSTENRMVVGTLLEIFVCLFGWGSILFLYKRFWRFSFGCEMLLILRHHLNVNVNDDLFSSHIRAVSYFCIRGFGVSVLAVRCCWYWDII